MTTEARARPAGRLPRWACRASLFQPHEPAFWLYVLLLVGTGLLALGQQRALREMSPSGWALSWLLLALYVVPMFLLVYLLDAYEREPLSLVVGALLWGAVAATSLAGLANHDWGAVVARLLGPDVASRWTPALTATLVEETLKALGVVLIYLIARSEINGVVDGFVYGAMVGLGSPWSRTSSTSSASSAASRPASSVASSSASWPAACTATCSTPA